MTDTFKLSFPIPEMGSRAAVSEITFRRPKIRDLREINRASKDGDEVGQLVAMVAGCTDLSPEQIEQIDAVDMTGLAEAIIPFFPTDPASKTET